MPLYPPTSRALIMDPSIRTLSFTAVSNTAYRVDASGGSVTVTVPIALSTLVSIKNIGSTGTVMIKMASGTIDGAAFLFIPTQQQARTIIADGTNGEVF